MDHWAKRACTVLLCAGTHFLPAQTFTTIYNFCAKAGCTDGQSPGASLVQATDGNLYGTTRLGGANGKGTVFRITPSGALTTLYSFCSLPACADGEGPTAGLVQAADGNLYGITAGGADSLGTVFQITPAGTLTTLHTFCPETGCTDGYGPYGGLVEVSDGNLYGTTEWGGVYGSGTVFKITPAGVLTRLHSFCSGKGCAEGWNPVATLLEGTSGALYGTTLNGGPGDGKGTVFKITRAGEFTTLYSFCANENWPYGCAAGDMPWAGLMQAAGGSLYGTTNTGGNGTLSGTIFKLTASGLTTLHTFCSAPRCTDGEAPYAGLIQGSDGRLYGTTSAGGAFGRHGAVFRITATGSLTTLHSFCAESGCPDGADPFGGLVQHTDGNFYGTTSVDGAFGGGTVFSISVGIAPFVKTQTTSGTVGAAVNILGSNFTGSTSVTFNGVATTFVVLSKSLITATVPAGASSGTVQVVTPGGTLSSNVPFRVLP